LVYTLSPFFSSFTFRNNNTYWDFSQERPKTYLLQPPTTVEPVKVAQKPTRHSYTSRFSDDIPVSPVQQGNDTLRNRELPERLIKAVRTVLRLLQLGHPVLHLLLLDLIPTLDMALIGLDELPFVLQTITESILLLVGVGIWGSH
jgi:hypothetical protein